MRQDAMSRQSIDQAEHGKGSPGPAALIGDEGHSQARSGGV